jgi:metallo-beta-lactamase family protein
VKARVERIEGFSGHADRDELLRWAGALREKPTQAFVIHGEASVAARFSATLAEKLGWQAQVPEPGQTVELE